MGGPDLGQLVCHCQPAGITGTRARPACPANGTCGVGRRFSRCSRGGKLGSHKGNLAHTPLQPPPIGERLCRGAPITNINIVFEQSKVKKKRGKVIELLITAFTKTILETINIFPFSVAGTVLSFFLPLALVLFKYTKPVYIFIALLLMSLYM